METSRYQDSEFFLTKTDITACEAIALFFCYFTHPEISECRQWSASALLRKKAKRTNKPILSVMNFVSLPDKTGRAVALSHYNLSTLCHQSLHLRNYSRKQLNTNKNREIFLT